VRGSQTLQGNVGGRGSGCWDEDSFYDEGFHDTCMDTCTPHLYHYLPFIGGLFAVFKDLDGFRSTVDSLGELHLREERLLALSSRRRLEFRSVGSHVY
jgi:hypothetical protein